MHRYAGNFYDYIIVHCSAVALGSVNANSTDSIVNKVHIDGNACVEDPVIEDDNHVVDGFANAGVSVKVKDVDILVDGNDNLLVMDNTSVGCAIGDSISVAHFAIIFDINITKPLQIVMHA